MSYKPHDRTTQNCHPDGQIAITQKIQGWFHSKHRMKDLIYKTFHVFKVQWDDFVQGLPCVTPRWLLLLLLLLEHTLTHWHTETLRSLSKSLKLVYWSKWVILVQSAPHTLWAPTCWGLVLHKILNLRQKSCFSSLEDLLFTEVILRQVSLTCQPVSLSMQLSYKALNVHTMMLFT